LLEGSDPGVGLSYAAMLFVLVPGPLLFEQIAVSREFLIGHAGREGVMYRLMVSFNAGLSYSEEATEESAEELLPQAVEYDSQGLRWTIEDEDGEIIEISSIQKSILSQMEQWRRKH